MHTSIASFVTISNYFFKFDITLMQDIFVVPLSQDLLLIRKYIVIYLPYDISDGLIRYFFYFKYFLKIILVVTFVSMLFIGIVGVHLLLWMKAAKKFQSIHFHSRSRTIWLSLPRMRKLTKNLLLLLLKVISLTVTENIQGIPFLNLNWLIDRVIIMLNSAIKI